MKYKNDKTFGNDSIDFDNFPAPKLRSSMLPSFKPNSTQEILDGVDDFSRTPDFLEVKKCKIKYTENSKKNRKMEKLKRQ